MNRKENTKPEVVPIRIKLETKEQSENIFELLGVNTPNEEYVNLAMIIESTGGNGKVSEKNKHVLNLYTRGQIDYETAVLAIKRSFMNE